MATTLFTKYLESRLTENPSIKLDSDNIKVALIDNGVDVPNVVTDQFLSDIASGARIAISGNLASKTTTDGVFDAADITINAVSGASVESLVIFKDTGSVATSPLIAYIDSGLGLPFTPSGGNVLIEWDNSVTRIFAFAACP